MAINFLPNPVYRFKDTNDNVLSGGLVFTYDTGTTNKQTVWKDKAKVAAHTNPIVLDARGEAEIWFDGTLDLVTAPAGDTDPPTSPIETIVGVQSSIDPASQAQSGLILNPSFEASASELTNWTSTPAAGATIAVDLADPVDGSNAVKFTAGGSGGGKLETDFIPVTTGNILVTNGMVKSDNTSLTNEVKLAFFDKDKVAVSTLTIYTNNAVSTTIWAEFSGQVTTPATAVWCKVELHGSSAGAGITWFDAIHLVLEKNTDFSLIDVSRGIALNSIFERGIGSLRYWTATPTLTSTISVSSTVSITGSRSLEFVATSVLGGGEADSDFLPVTGGHILVIEAMVQSSATNLTNLIDIREYDKDKAFIQTNTAYTSGGVSSTSFERIIGQRKLGSNARYVKIRLRGAFGSAGTVNFDRVHVTDEMDDSLKYCHVSTITTQGIPTGVSTLIVWGNEVSDIWNMHSTSTDPGYINMPPWCEHVRLTLGMKMGTAAANTDIYARIRRISSTSVVAEISINVAAGEEPAFTIVTPWLNTISTHIYVAEILHNDSGILNVEQTSASNAVFFQAEFKAK